ncbi:MAG TPA: endonuclease/exonuclease/phosphatase family protein [Pyrinomonadaceae bacterium]
MFLVDAIPKVFVYRLTLAALTVLVLLTLASQFGQFVYLELTTHFRLQYVLASLVCAIVLVAFQSWKFLPIAIFCAVINAVYLGPYLRTNPAPPQITGVRVRLLHANVLKGNTNYQAVLDLVNEANADVVVLQEFTEDWSEHTQELRVKYPYFSVEPRLQGAGMAIFSRYPYEELQALKLDDSTHLAILARLKLAGTTLSVLSMHPPTPITPAKFRNRNQQFSEAAELLKQTGGPKVLIGDLNITMWSPYFKTLIQNSGLRDSRSGLGLYPTWPMPLPSFLRLPIDHCLVSSDIQVNGFQIGSRTGSDHRPIIVDLTIAGPPASSPAGSR